jgi:hypothetical protein
VPVSLSVSVIVLPALVHVTGFPVPHWALATPVETHSIMAVPTIKKRLSRTVIYAPPRLVLEQIITKSLPFQAIASTQLRRLGTFYSALTQLRRYSVALIGLKYKIAMPNK